MSFESSIYSKHVIFSIRVRQQFVRDKVTRDVARDVVRDVARDVARDVVRDVTRDVVHDVARDVTRDDLVLTVIIARDVGRWCNARDVTRDVVRLRCGPCEVVRWCGQSNSCWPVMSVCDFVGPWSWSVMLVTWCVSVMWSVKWLNPWMNESVNVIRE